MKRLGGTKDMWINLIASIGVFAVGAFILLQIWVTSGGNQVGILGSKCFAIKGKKCINEKVTGRDIAQVAFCSMAFRIVIYLISALALRIIWEDENILTMDSFLEAWRKWDANNYIRIATVGYGGFWIENKATTLVFFPLYSWIIKFFLLFINSEEIAALLVASLCYIVGCCFFYAWIVQEYGKETAKNATIFISVFPFSFFLGAMMPESTFFMVASACLYFIKKHHWKKATVMGILCCLARMQGMLLVIPAFLEWMEVYRPIEKIREKQYKELWKAFYTKALFIPFMSIGSFIYLGINKYVTGNAFQFLVYQKEVWNQESQYFGKTVSQIWERAFGAESGGSTGACVWIPEFLLFFIVLATVWYGVKRHKPQYTLFLLLYLVMNYLPTWLLSGGRYMTVALPMFVIWGDAATRHKTWGKGLMAFSSVLFGVYLIGYLMYKQIM